MGMLIFSMYFLQLTYILTRTFYILIHNIMKTFAAMSGPSSICYRPNGFRDERNNLEQIYVFHGGRVQDSFDMVFHG